MNEITLRRWRRRGGVGVVHLAMNLNSVLTFRIKDDKLSQ